MNAYQKTHGLRSKISGGVTPLSLILVLLLGSGIYAQDTKAFPSAVGYGAYAARVDVASASVYVVSNLNDSGAGSFRDAVSAGNRVIVFDTTGVIALSDANGDLTITADNLYIAGQTSPGGIVIHAADTNWVRFDDPINIIVRGLMFSGGDDDMSNPAPGDNQYDDALQVVGVGSGVYLDRLEMVHGDDETLNFNVAQSVDVGSVDSSTIAYCVVMEAMDDVTNGQSNHSFQISILPYQDMEITVYRNAFGQGRRRNAKFFGKGFKLAQSSWPIFDVQQNLIYNWGQNTMHMEDADTNFARINMVNNYYREGPLSGGYSLAMELYRTTPDAGQAQIYYAGNRWDTSGGVSDADFATYVTVNNADSVDTLLSPVVIPFRLQVPVVSADTAYQRVLDSAGVFWCDSSFWVNRLKGDVTGRTGGLFSNSPATWSSSDLPTLAHPGDLADADGDQMSDAFELAQGSNPEHSDDQMLDNDGDGYTALEEYLEWIITGKADIVSEQGYRSPSRTKMKKYRGY